MSRVRHCAGFTAVELCLLISGLGILLAMVVPTFARTLRVSKTAEAGEQLAHLVAGAQAYYADFHRVPVPEPAEAMGQPGPDDRLHTHCLPDSAGPLPPTPSTSAVMVAREGLDVAAAATFRALGFAPTQPLRYAYTYRTSAAGCELQSRDEPTTVRFVAHGDLDGDGRLSAFARQATVTPEGLQVDPLLMVDNPIE